MEASSKIILSVWPAEVKWDHSMPYIVWWHLHETFTTDKSVKMESGWVVARDHEEGQMRYDY